MDQSKIGAFIKKLRNEKDLNQEKLAEQFGVSRRTVSRWETGRNMPDLAILMEIVDYFDVDFKELLDGERKGEKMDKDLEETVLKVADYSNNEKSRIMKVSRILFVVGLISLVINTILNELNLSKTFWVGFARGASFALPFAVMIFGLIFTNRYMKKLNTTRKEFMDRK